MGCQLGGVVSEMTVQIIQGMQISEGQIIQAILYTDTHRHIQIPFSHFALFGSFGIHAKYIWHTTDLHMHRYSDICTETLTHRYRYTERHASL